MSSVPSVSGRRAEAQLRGGSRWGQRPGEVGGSSEPSFCSLSCSRCGCKRAGQALPVLHTGFKERKVRECT